MLVGVLPGDYNLNGIVDAADYTVWRDTLGSMSDLRADGSGNGKVDADDYTVWKSHFGQTLPAPGGGSGAAVETVGLLAVQNPEPVAEVLPEVASAPAEPIAAAARAASFALHDVHSREQDTPSRSRVHLSRRRVADSGHDQLLVLALDRVGRFRRQDVPATLGRETQDSLAQALTRPSITDDPLTLAFADWR